MAYLGYSLFYTLVGALLGVFLSTAVATEDTFAVPCRENAVECSAVPCTIMTTDDKCLLQNSKKTGVLKQLHSAAEDQSTEDQSTIEDQSVGKEYMCPMKASAPSCKNSGQYHLNMAERGVSMEMISNSTQSKFDSIYTGSVWSHGKVASKSGEGSGLRQTKDLCGVLHAAVVKRLSQKGSGQQSMSILDAPSGDWFWMPSCLEAIAISLPAVTLKYQGVDVSSVAVGIAEQKRQELERNLSRIHTSRFLQMDLAEPNILRQKFGADAFDVIVCHDALQHNPHKNVHKILDNFASVGKMLVVDVDRASKNSLDIPVGDFRAVDITQPPYSFSAICMDVNEAQICDGENEWFAMFHLPLDSAQKTSA